MGDSVAALDLKDLPAPIQLIARGAYGDSFGLLFLIVAAVSVLILVSVLLAREMHARHRTATRVC